MMCLGFHTCSHDVDVFQTTVVKLGRLAGWKEKKCWQVEVELGILPGGGAEVGGIQRGGAAMRQLWQGGIGSRNKEAVAYRKSQADMLPLAPSYSWLPSMGLCCLFYPHKPWAPLAVKWFLK